MGRVRSRMLVFGVGIGVGALGLAASAAAAPLAADRQLRLFTVAGSGAGRFSGNGGPATDAGLRVPVAVASLPDGGFLVATRVDGRVRRVSPGGTITTVAGNGRPGFSGDGGPAVRASLIAAPLVAAPDGGFYVGAGNRVRRVSPGGRITTVAVARRRLRDCCFCLEAVASAGACTDSRRSSGMAARRGDEMRCPRVVSNAARLASFG